MAQRNNLTNQNLNSQPVPLYQFVQSNFVNRVPTNNFAPFNVDQSRTLAQPIPYFNNQNTSQNKTLSQSYVPLAKNVQNNGDSTPTLPSLSMQFPNQQFSMPAQSFAKPQATANVAPMQVSYQQNQAPTMIQHMQPNMNLSGNIPNQQVRVPISQQISHNLNNQQSSVTSAQLIHAQMARQTTNQLVNLSDNSPFQKWQKKNDADMRATRDKRLDSGLQQLDEVVTLPIPSQNNCFNTMQEQATCGADNLIQIKPTTAVDATDERPYIPMPAQIKSPIDKNSKQQDTRKDTGSKFVNPILNIESNFEAPLKPLREDQQIQINADFNNFAGSNSAKPVAKHPPFKITIGPIMTQQRKGGKHAQPPAFKLPEQATTAQTITVRSANQSSILDQEALDFDMNDQDDSDNESNMIEEIIADLPDTPAPVKKEIKRRRTRKNLKLITKCEHTDKKHYSNNMCFNCYHRFGRKKKATCHPERNLYARGCCKACYLSRYRREKKQQEVAAEEAKEDDKKQE